MPIPESFDDIKLAFPVSKIRNLVKLNPHAEMLNADAVTLIGKATEFFIEELTRLAYTQAVLEKRVTIQPKDINNVIESNPSFEFLQHTLDNWLEDVEEAENNDADDDTIIEETNNEPAESTTDQPAAQSDEVDELPETQELDASIP